MFMLTINGLSKCFSKHNRVILSDQELSEPELLPGGWSDPTAHVLLEALVVVPQLGPVGRCEWVGGCTLRHMPALSAYSGERSKSDMAHCASYL